MVVFFEYFQHSSLQLKPEKEIRFFEFEIDVDVEIDVEVEVEVRKKMFRLPFLRL
jgi:hypothetical protein